MLMGLHSINCTDLQAQVYILAGIDPHLGQILIDQMDQCIYGIKGTCWTYLSTKYNPSTQASVHAHYIPAYTGPLHHIAEIKIYMKSPDYFPHVSTYSSS